MLSIKIIGGRSANVARRAARAGAMERAHRRAGTACWAGLHRAACLQAPGVAPAPEPQVPALRHRPPPPLRPACPRVPCAAAPAPRPAAAPRAASDPQGRWLRGACRSLEVHREGRRERAAWQAGATAACRTSKPGGGGGGGGARDEAQVHASPLAASVGSCTLAGCKPQQLRGRHCLHGVGSCTPRWRRQGCCPDLPRPMPPAQPPALTAAGP